MSNTLENKLDNLESKIQGIVEDYDDEIAALRYQLKSLESERKKFIAQVNKGVVSDRRFSNEEKELLADYSCPWFVEPE